MKKLIIASALTIATAGSALAADNFSFGIILGVPVTPAYASWDRGAPAPRDYRPVVVRAHDDDCGPRYGFPPRHRHDRHDRQCRIVREEYRDHGRVVTTRTVVCDSRHDDRFRHDPRDRWYGHDRWEHDRH